ncbi:P1 family peptidase [Novosphingobium profundi]|nr:P1 family peptidase [Novosphingobium profundi]
MAGVGVLALVAAGLPLGAKAPGALRGAGVPVGILPAGPLDAITDVAGVLVGQVTLEQGTRVHTGVTAVLPHGGNLWQDKVPAGFYAANGYGKFAGSTQIEDLGEIETPILLTNTLSVPEAMAASVEWTLDQPGNAQVRSVNAVVGETNDGFLNDIRGRHVTIADARRAIEAARGGPVAEGVVGAGAGTVTFGWKGGIGTASRKLPESLGGWTVGVLAQTNYGGVLSVAGVPVGQRLGQYLYKDKLPETSADGSVVLVIATDAPLSDRNLRRLAQRAFVGISRTGSAFSNGSGDYAVAFSSAASVRRTPQRREALASISDLANDAMTPLFQAVAEASEESVYNALFAAHDVSGFRGTVKALPKAEVRAMLARAPRN